MSKAQIFMSQSAEQRKHRAYLKALVKELREKDVDPWVDCERLKPGDIWNEQITNANSPHRCPLPCPVWHSC